ncbi:MAG: transglutaminase domain-containing protein [Fibrobacteres bacterium]|nr:transglutaminase domain-containing protein [Fibrobacterota bacterium]
MLRMFDFVALAQSKLAGLVDTCRSHEKILEEKQGGGWAYVKSAGVTVFKRPFMGQDSLASVQAAHLYRSGRYWLLVEMEELPDSSAPVHLRSGTPRLEVASDPGDLRSGDLRSGGVPSGSVPSRALRSGTPTQADAGSASGAANLFPVSRLAPSQAGLADRLRLRLTLRNGEAWEGLLPLGPGQVRLRALSPSDWIVENRKVAPGPRAAAPTSASDARWLSSNSFLVLTDTLLQATAASIAGKETDPQRIADAVYRWVSDRFHFRLGSVLFGASPEVLRNLTGDCSEAAVLTAALLRARGVPARIALGFASLGRGVFIGHAWCEARLGGEWVGVDAALREFPSGVERIKLAELDGRENLQIAATNLMMRLIANLDVQIEGAWKDGKPLPLKRFEGNAAEAEKYFQDILDGATEKP